MPLCLFYINHCSFSKSVEKIQILLELLDKEFKKKFNITNNLNLDVEITQEYLFGLKKFYQFYLLCLVELCNKINHFGLGFLSVTIMQMFQTFRVNMAFFMKFNIFFFKMKNLYTESKTDDAPQESYTFFSTKN